VYEVRYRHIYDSVYRHIYDSVYRHIYDSVYRNIYDSVCKLMLYNANNNVKVLYRPAAALRYVEAALAFPVFR